MTVLGAGLMLGGSILTLIATIGVYRFPDVLTRLHGATKAASVGIALVVLGAGAALGPALLALAALVAVFQVLTAPVAAHVLGRAARPEPEASSRSSASFPAVASVAGLAAIWLILWGDITPANIAGGLALGAGLTWLGRGRRTGRISVSIPAVIRLGAVFAGILTRSTLAVASAALGPARLMKSDVRRVPLPASSVTALLATANAVSLTPGTLTLAIDLDEPALTIHLIGSAERAITDIKRLHTLTTASFPASG